MPRRSANIGSGVGVGRGRGGRGRRGDGPVRIKVARVVREQQQALLQPGVSGAGYEDGMLYVRETNEVLVPEVVLAPRKRGRPSKRDLPAPSAPASATARPEVIYVPSFRHRCVVGTRGRGRGRGSVQYSTSILRSVQNMPCQLQHYHSRPLSLFKPRKCPQGGWPEDLQELKDMWDTLPHAKILELKSWFRPQVVAGPPYPEVVERIHELITAWQEPWEDKLRLVEGWLLRDQALSPSPHVSQPKVVVEAQPHLVEVCHWSSMAEY